MPIAIKMAGKEIASYDTTTDKVAIKLGDDVSINDSAGNVVLNESGGSVTLNNGTISSSTLDGIKLKSSGNSITKSDGTTSVLSESGGVVTLNNITVGSNVSGIGQLIGISYAASSQTAGNQVTLESSKSYHVIHSSYQSAVPATYVEYTELSTDSSGNVTITTRINLDTTNVVLESTDTNLVRIKAPSSSSFIANVAFIFEQGSTFDAS